MSSRRIRISAREMIEILAGRRTVQEMNTWRGWSAPGEGPMPNFFDCCLMEGRLPSSVSVIKTDENDADDWIEIEFSDPDPAISPFR